MFALILQAQTKPGVFCFQTPLSEGGLHLMHFKYCLTWTWDVISPAHRWRSIASIFIVFDDETAIQQQWSYC